ncbi:MAG: hypothetical protein RLZZ15_1244 [Verrucomicrobiota bacterium]|jgi:hypothetical protein
MTAAAFPRRGLVRAAGVVAVLAFLGLVARFWHPVFGFTAFIQLDGASEQLKISAFRELPIFVHPGAAGYDGLYYAQLAQDPTLRHPEFPRAMDNFAYRARRILPPALAWTLGAGRPAWIVHVYSLLNVTAWLALAALLWRLLAAEDARGWLAWAGVLFSAGALASVRLALSDLVALAIMAGALLAVERGKKTGAAAVLALAALARETSVLALGAVVETEKKETRDQRPETKDLDPGGLKSLVSGLWSLVPTAALVAAPLAAWLAYIRWRVGPADQGWANFTLPVVGLVEKFSDALAALVTVADKPLAWTTLLATVGLTVQAAFFLTRWRPADRWWRLGAPYAGLLLCLGTAVWEGFPGAATRALLPLTLAFNLAVHRARAPLAWLIAGNITVFSGLLALRDVPRDANELATAHTDGVAAIVRINEGWFGVENARRHEWTWSPGSGTVEFQAWPRRARTVRLEFTLRSLAPRTVEIAQPGRAVTRVTVGTRPLATHIDVQLGEDGRARVRFSTDTPGVPESPHADARALTFALYDPRLVLEKR